MKFFGALSDSMKSVILRAGVGEKKDGFCQVEGRWVTSGVARTLHALHLRGLVFTPVVWRDDRTWASAKLTKKGVQLLDKLRQERVAEANSVEQARSAQEESSSCVKIHTIERLAFDVLVRVHDASIARYDRPRNPENGVTWLDLYRHGRTVVITWSPTWQQFGVSDVTNDVGYDSRPDELYDYDTAVAKVIEILTNDKTVAYRAF